MPAHALPLGDVCHTYSKAPRPSSSVSAGTAVTTRLSYSGPAIDTLPVGTSLRLPMACVAAL
jgi:hypothetical protein